LSEAKSGDDARRGWSRISLALNLGYALWVVPELADVADGGAAAAR
jgi:hypothetical protein